MRKVSVDTCVFFRLIKQNERYIEYGREGLEKFAEQDRINRDLKKQEILDYLPESFKEKYKNLNFLRLIDQYISETNGDISNAERAVKQYESIEGDYFYDKKGNKVPKSAKEKLYNRSKEYLSQIKEVYNESLLKKLREEYKFYEEMYSTNLLFRQCLDGEIKFYIVSTAYDEVDNHIEEKCNNTNPDYLTFPQAEVDRLSQNYFTIIKVDQNLTPLVDEIANKFRTSIDKSAVPMKEDKNKKNVYGDSYIMVESSLACLPLLTLNVKDFIDNTGVKNMDDKIRKHISLVESVDDRLTDAKPYSVKEIIKGEFCDATRESSAVNISVSENQSGLFLEEMEMF